MGYFPLLSPISFSLSALHVGSVIWVKVVICQHDSHFLPSLYPEQEEKGKRVNDHVIQEILLAYDDGDGDDDDGLPLSLW